MWAGQPENNWNHSPLIQTSINQKTRLKLKQTITTKVYCYIKSLVNIQQDINSFEDFKRFQEWNIFNEIDQSIPSTKLHKYTEYQKRCPSFNDVYYDHGIYGANLFLRLMHELFLEPNMTRTQQDGSEVIFDKKLLHRALKKVSRAIAIHNIDSYENALKRSRVSNERIFVLHGDSLGWLLKVADELQEWYKFPRSMIEEGDFDLPPLDYSINCYNNKIRVNNYPKNNHQLKEKIKKYYSPGSDFILI